MQIEQIKQAIQEAERFIKAAEACIAARRLTYTVDKHVFQPAGPKESGALRRASMDLTRQLAKMRQP